MFKRIYTRWLIAAGGVLCSASLLAQSPRNWVDFGYIKNTNAWLTSENAAGLNSLSIDKISIAEAFANKNDGRFINYFQSNNSFSFGGLTESFLRLNDKVVFYGKIKYSNFSGKNMGGSMLVDPYSRPFDIVEFADSTAGKKEMENYQLSGAASIKIRDGFLLGIKGDYDAISYYKIKDLRHTNDLMQFCLTTGLRYQLHKSIDAGINYYYQRATESISFESFGNTDQQFNSLIDFGSFLGRQELFGRNGYTAYKEDYPFFNSTQGVTFQVDVFPQNKFHIYNELGAKWSNGYYGIKGSSNVKYTKDESSIYHYKGVASYKAPHSLHQIQVSLAHKKSSNSEMVWREETSAGGVTSTVYYGQNKVMSRTNMSASLGYTGNLQIEGNSPKWILQGKISAEERDQTTTVHPLFRKQTIDQYSGEISAKRNIIHDNNMYTLTLGTEYASGGGTEKEDGEYGSSSSQRIVKLDRYLYREFEYLTTSRASGTAGFRYSRMLPKNLQVYGDINYRFTKAFSVTYIGDTFGQLAIAIGCAF